MAARLRGGQAAPAIFDFFFFSQRVVNAREDFDVLLEDGRERMCRCFAFGSVLFC